MSTHPRLGPSDLRVFRVPLVAHGVQPHDPLHLSSEERLRAARLRKPRDRLRYAVSHSCLRAILAAFTGMTPEGIHIARTKAGKPYLDGDVCPPVRFSLSHSGDWAIIALSSLWPVGVDVERVRSRIEAAALVERCFSAAEREVFRKIPLEEQTRRFYQAWVRKEAYVKARGDGIPDRLSSFSVSFDDHPENGLLQDARDPGARSRWTLRDVAIADGYVAAVAVKGKIDNIRVQDWHAPA